MERYRGLIEDGAIFLLMAVFTVMKQLLVEEGEINWSKSIAKVFVNFVAGVGFYTLLLSYQDWFGQYPQKVGVVMIVTYVGSKTIDIFVDKFYDWFKKFDFKDLIRRLMNL